MFANHGSLPIKYGYSAFNILEKCPHSELVPSQNSLKNCLKCGIHISNDPNCQAFKSYKHNFKSLMDIQAFTTAIFDKKSQAIFIKEENPYRKNRPYLLDWIFAVSEKLKFSFNTIHLAIFYLDFFLSQELVPSYQQQLYALTSVFISAKAVELDERIPFISKLLSAGSNLFKPDEIRRAEHVLLAFFNWNLQTPTLIDMLEFYLSQGVVFSTDELDTSKGEKGVEPLKEKNSNNQDESCPSKVVKKDSISDNSLIRIVEKELSNLFIGGMSQASPQEGTENDNFNGSKTVLVKNLREESLCSLVKELENQIYRLSNHILREPSLLEIEPKILAAACIAFLRKVSFLSPVWNDELKQISGGVCISELKPALTQLISKYERIFLPRPEYFEPQPIIASKISVKSELQQKPFVSMHAPYDLSRYTNGSQNQNQLKPSVSLNENKNSGLSYKNYGVTGFNSVSTAQSIQSKHYNYPKSSNSILPMGQYNYIRYPSNNNIK